MSKLV
ncbi:hypothetical protein B4U80_01991 [Leptotrombidium deliense]